MGTRKQTLGLVLFSLGAVGASIAVYTGCFSPNYADGKIACGANGECPSGLSCIQDLCYKPGSLPPDAGIGPVTVIVYNGRGQLAPGLNVAFHTPDGKAIAVVPTGADGKATHDLVEGGMVTAGVPDPSSLQPISLYTIMWTLPNHTYTLGRAGVDNTPVGTVTVTFPFGAYASAVQYTVDLGCTSTQTYPGAGVAPSPVTLDIPKNCVSPGNTFTVVAYALDNNYTTLAYAYQRNVGVASGAVNLGSSGWQPLSNFQVNMTNAPPFSMQGCDAIIDAGSGGGHRCGSISIGGWSNGVSFRNSGSSQPFTIVPGGNANVTVKVPKGAFDGFNYNVQIDYGANAGVDGSGALIKQFANVPDSDSPNLGAEFLPRVSNVQLNTNDLAKLEVTWNSDKPIQDADALFTIVGWSVASDGGPSINHTWFVEAPGTMTSPLTMPQLPAELIAYQPTAGVTFSTPALIILEFSNLSSFQDFLDKIGLGLFSDNGFPPGVYTGRASFSSFK